MKKNLLLTAAVTLLFFTVYDAATGQTFEVNRYDEATGNRILVTNNEKIDHEGFTGSAFVSAMFGRDKTESNEHTEHYTLVIEIFSEDGFEVFNADSVNFTIDDEMVRYKLFVIATERREQSNFESCFVQLTKTDFERFGKARDLRFRILNNDFTITQNAKDALLLVLREI